VLFEAERIREERVALRVRARDGVSPPTPRCWAHRHQLQPAAVARLMFVEHEKKTFFSLLDNTRSEEGGQGRTLSARSSERARAPARAVFARVGWRGADP
jgi:hypothetical protein